MLGEDGGRNRLAVGCQWMTRRYDDNQPDRQQPFASELWRHDRHGSYYADGTAPVQHRLQRVGPCFDVEAQRGCRESRLEGSHGAEEWLAGKHAVDHDAQFRFELSSQALCPGLEEVHVGRDRACVGEKRAALLGQHRKASAAIEEFHAELSFQIRQGLAHDRLGSS